MGFANNTCILDRAPETLWSKIPDRLREFAFRGIDNIPEMQSYGWVNFEDMLDSTWNGDSPGQSDLFCLFIEA